MSRVVALARRFFWRFFVSAIAFLLVFPSITQAQIAGDTLQSVEIRGRKTDEIGTTTKLAGYALGQKILSIDSAILKDYQQQSLATMLAEQLPVFVKSYGFNSLSTISFRGASAAQTQVLWEGIPLQNAASGIADISLLPVAMLDDVQVVYGSSAALLGSGNVGGAIVLNNKKLTFDHEDAFGGLGMGSFDHWTGTFGTAFANKKWSFLLKGYMQNAQNYFPYKDAQGQEKTMDNARLFSETMLLSIAHRLNAYNTLTFQSWQQLYERGIPPALFESYSAKVQYDNAQRFVVDWKHERRQRWYVKAAYLRDQLRYIDSAISLESNSIIHHFFGESGWEKALSERQRVLFFVPVQLFLMKGTEDHHQLKTAIAGAFNQTSRDRKLAFAVNGRAEMINEKFIALPGINGSYKATKWLKLMANGQRTYRAPTLNEWYYNPGGNPDLKPERGWHFDGGYEVIGALGSHIRWAHSGAAYNRYIKDWIIWLGGAIFTPHNLASVHSRGIETENQITYKADQFSASIGAKGSYNKATTLKSYLSNDNSIGKQIPYTPAWNGQLNASIGWRGVELNYNQSITGRRFITSDESQFLAPYSTGNLRASWKLVRPLIEWRFYLQCQNVGNVSYEVVGYRPMPGRNWMIGITTSQDFL